MQNIISLFIGGVNTSGVPPSGTGSIPSSVNSYFKAGVTIADESSTPMGKEANIRFFF